ncbi:phage major capsid protein [Gordonia sp. SND2]|uniref:phage major capsid protein n=1 Tax=Gordonia sp. SND2 TaxID=3388659 RepID=UPI00398BA8B0
MTNFLGQDGRLNFLDQSDDQLRARRAELLKEGNAFVAKERKSGADIERAGRIVNHAHAIDAELKSRAERRAAGDSGDARRINHDEGTLGAGLGGSVKAGYLTGRAVKAAAEGMAAKIAQAREGKSLTAAGGTEVHVVDPGLAPMGRPTTVLDVVPVIGASAPAIRYMRQTSRTNAAAVVAAGATKPTSTYGVTPVDRTRKVLAHLSEPLQEYDIIDVPALRDFVDTELQFGLMAALERELFYGDGTASHLHGIAQESGVQAVTFDTDLFRTTRKAVTAVVNLGYNPAVFVVSPSDLETIDLATTSGSGEFVNKAGPFDPAEAKLWGVRVVVSTQLDAGEAFLLSDDSVKIYADTGATVRTEWDRTGDDFTKNAVRCRLEGRFEVGVSRPEAIVKIDTSAAA